MLYVVLVVYVMVVIIGLLHVILCSLSGCYEAGAQGLIIVGTLIGTCSCTITGFYSAKAAKENEIKLSNDKYRMRLEIAKEIFKEYGNSLDDRSVDLLRKLMSDKDISEIPLVSEQVKPVWQGNVAQGDFDLTNMIRNDSEEGLG